VNDETPKHFTGQPMAESCETTDFFEGETIYREQARNRPQLADALKGQFWCAASFVHPSTGILTATGVYRSADNRPWNPYPVHFVLTNWKDGWDEIGKGKPGYGSEAV
jgi:hypothetical protein